MTASTRRVGAETSKTRDVLLDCVQQLMFEEGYASVSYRAVAAQAGVTPSLVQYYFPTLDSVFVATIRRYSERNLKRLNDILQRHPDQPLRALWKFSWDEASGAMITEFMALGNHRKSIRAEIAEVTEQMRELQIEALATKFGSGSLPDIDLSREALLLLLTGIPKLLNLEKGIGVATAHRDLVKAFERYLDVVEPKPKRRTRPAGSRKRP
jgi:AcrR family transcriptional regulator